MLAFRDVTLIISQPSYRGLASFKDDPYSIVLWVNPRYLSHLLLGLVAEEFLDQDISIMVLSFGDILAVFCRSFTAT